MFRSSTFSPDSDIPDLKDKIILVTGGNNGLGYETVLRLAKHLPERIYLAARSPDKGLAAITSIKKEVPTAPLTFLQLDLASFQSIKAAVKDFQSKEERLDVLVNNAGIMATPPGLTADGYELQFGTNHVGHALLTRLLLPTLLATAARPAADVRVVALSSAGEMLAPKPGLALADAKTDMAAYSTWTRYGQSKLANVLYTRALAAAHPDLLCVAVHPGAVSTGLVAGPQATYPLLGGLLGLFGRLVGVSPQIGAWGQLWAATAPRDDVQNGAFYHPFRRLVLGSKNAQSERLERELWDWTEVELERGTTVDVTTK